MHFNNNLYSVTIVI